MREDRRRLAVVMSLADMLSYVHSPYMYTVLQCPANPWRLTERTVRAGRAAPSTMICGSSSLSSGQWSSLSPHCHNISVYDPMTMQLVYNIVGKGKGGGGKRFQSAIVVDILEYATVASSVFGGGGDNGDIQ